MYKAKIILEYLYPVPTPYEIVDYNLANISFNVVHYMEKRLLIFEKQFNKILFFQNLLLLIIFLLFLKVTYNFNFYNNSLKLWIDL